MTNTHLLVDGNNLLMRAVYATVGSGMIVNEVNTGALLVFINTLTKHIREEEATHVGVAWDSPGLRHRQEIDPEYKENRSLGPVAVQRALVRPLAKEFCEVAGIFQRADEGYEADDIIAAWWYAIQPTTPEDKIVILSSDKDFLQLLGDNGQGVSTEQTRLGSFNAKTDRWSGERVRQFYGCDPERLPYLMALMGDNVDNVVGVHGVGPKVALRMMTKACWDFEAAVATLNVQTDQERVRRNLDLVSLREPALRLSGPENFVAPPVDHLPLRRFLAIWQLQSVLDRLPDLWKIKPLPGKRFSVPVPRAAPLP